MLIWKVDGCPFQTTGWWLSLYIMYLYFDNLCRGGNESFYVKVGASAADEILPSRGAAVDGGSPGDLLTESTEAAAGDYAAQKLH